MDHLSQPVEKGDLILVHAPGWRGMHVVTSAPDDENPGTASVIVKRVFHSFLDKPGRWVLDGPEVRYTMDDDDEENEHRRYDSEYESESEVEDEPELSFRAVIDSLHWGTEPTVIVNPHGRDALKYYFGGECPECFGAGWTCPGCGPFRYRYPDLRGSCAIDQSCPICMGYDFAEEDSRFLREMDDIKGKIRHWKEEGKSVRGYQNEGLACIRERYSAINARLEEMGMPLVDVEPIERQWREFHCTH